VNPLVFCAHGWVNWLFQQNQVYVSTPGDGSMHIVANNAVTP